MTFKCNNKKCKREFQGGDGYRLVWPCPHCNQWADAKISAAEKRARIAAYKKNIKNGGL